MVNTLFYLRRFSEWIDGAAVFSEVPELVEQRALATALVSGAVNSVLPFYPRGPAAFAELWSEHSSSLATILEENDLWRGPCADALTALTLTNAIAPTTVQERMQGQSERLLQAAIAAEITTRATPDLSFEDEFESLRLGISHKAVAALSKTRYSHREGETFDALALLSAEYRS